MKLDYLKYAINNVTHRKMRSWLTVISILIGIMSIFALISFGQGLSNYVTTIAAETGVDKLIVQTKSAGIPGADESFVITKDEVDFLRKINGIKEVVGMYMKVVEVEHDDELKYVFMISLNTGKERALIEEMLTVELDKGRALKTGDRSKVVLGYNYQLENNLFERPITLRDKILIDGNKVEVIGFYEKIGNPQDDSNIYMTEEGVEYFYPEKMNKYGYVIARTELGSDPAEVAEKAEEKLRKFKDQKKGEEDFYIMTFEQAIEMFGSILSVINGVLVLIALVSLLVAGVNITNTMYTAVLERTKEIGIMKAIGAKNSDIVMIFLFESAVVGLVGGILGVLLGYLIAKGGGIIAANAGYSFLQPAFSPSLIIGCLLFSTLMGIIAGVMPARQASKMNPTDALHYE